MAANKNIVNRYDKVLKNQKKQHPLERLWKYLLPEKNKLIVTFIVSFLSVICLVAAPYILKLLSETILEFIKGNTFPVPLTDEYVSRIFLLSGISLGLQVGGFIFGYINVFLCSGMCARVGYGLRRDIVKKFNSLPLNYFDTRNIGDVLSYVSNDVDIVGTTLNEALANLLSSFLTILGIIVIMFLIDWKLAVITVVILPLGFFVLNKISDKSQDHFKIRQKLTSEVSSQSEESYTGFNIIRIFRATKDSRNSFASKNYELEKAMNKADYLSGVMMPLMTFFGNILFALIALVGGVIAFNLGDSGDVRIVAIANIVAAITYSQQLISPLNTIATVLGTLAQTSASCDRIFTFLDQVDEPDESNKTDTIKEIKGNIKFDHVKFGYTSDRVIVHDFSEIGKPGQKIAIVGPTGAGKTTMVNLLMRFYEVNSGSISIEGVNTKTLNRSYVRSLFGMVLQDTWLFEGTIMENLKFSRPTATDEEVYAACKATHCDTFIRQQPGGYDHVLNEDCGLSAGQKQLLTIARAMIQNAPMLILDEATSSVDTRTEAQIQDAMDKLMKGRTSFVIAHRLSTIKNSDLIIVMKDGDVIETGNHDELMKKDGFYAALYNAQFTGKGPQLA